MKNQTLNIVARLRLGLVAFALVTLVLGGFVPVGSAQTGSGSPPPTYDWDDTLPGIQGPTSPLLANAESRYLRTFAVQIPVLVPLAELQAALPPGFNATATPAGSNTGQVSINFFFQERSTRFADGVTVLGSGLLGSTTVMNTNLMPNRQETGLFTREMSTQESVDFYNAGRGPGYARLAKVNYQITEGGGNLSVKINVTDDDLGLNVSAEATCPGPIATRVKNDPIANVYRSLITQRSQFLANQNDQRAVPQAMANVKVETPDGKLTVPVAGGGSRSLTIVGIGATINFNRNAEVFTKYE